jgi:hypothetical protein
MLLPVVITFISIYTYIPVQNVPDQKKIQLISPRQLLMNLITSE